MRALWLLVLNMGCAFISDKHAAWRADPDGDGVSWGSDCDEGSADSSKLLVWYLDDDGDGYGDEASTVDACDQPDGYVAVAGDCDDGDAAVMPGVVDGCNTTDDDCDGDVDEDAVFGEWFLDSDGDGFGDASDKLIVCEPPSGRVQDATDCDDANAEANPAAIEFCDAIDNDCDDQIDEDVIDASQWYLDADGDGYGDPEVSVEACDLPTGYAPTGDDCDDTDAELWLAEPVEIFYNGIDDNCDRADGDGDADGDSYWALDYVTQVIDGGGVPMSIPEGASGDCDDDNGLINPGAVDSYYDGVDTNCDGASDFDQDGDGFDSDAYGGTDCDDVLAHVFPGGVETWYDGVDGDCDGASDFDQDGDGADSEDYGGTDCDDLNSAVWPGGVEIWYDGVDSDCDGSSDFDADGDGVDSEDYGGTDCDDLNSEVWPGGVDTWYDGVDSDCDGSSDFDADGDGADSEDYGGTDCDDGDLEVSPGATEICDNFTDEDCDGIAQLCNDLFLLTVTGAEVGDWTGAAVSGSAHEIAVGSPRYDGPGSEVGAVYRYPSTTRGRVWAADTGARLEGSYTGGHLGATVLTIPPGDAGDDQLAAAAPNADGTGVVYLLGSGGVSGFAESVADLVIWGSEEDASFGAALAIGDGVVDTGAMHLIVGATHVDTGAASVQMFDLALRGFVGASEADVAIVGEGSFGSSLVAMDINGDGQQDLFVGDATNQDSSLGTGVETGAVFGYIAPIVGSLEMDEYDSVWMGDSPYDRYGTALANVGDVDGDGIPDLAVGAAQDGVMSSGDDPGAIYIITEIGEGSHWWLDAFALFYGESGQDWTGGSIAAADFNADGYMDLLIGAHLSDAGATDAGRAYVVLGPFEEGSHQLPQDNYMTGVGEGNHLGDSVGVMPDLDGDGGAEILIGQSEAGALSADWGVMFLVSTGEWL